MILGVKKDGSGNREEALVRIRGIKEFYGIREHCLETLLQGGTL